MSAVKLAVFDVDGTLVDSRVVIQTATEAAFGAMGMPSPAYDVTRQVIGLGLAEALAILAPGVEGEDLDRLVLRYREAFLDLRRQPGFSEPLYEGAAQTLARLRADGWKVAMATGKSRRGVEMIVDAHGWAEVFDSTHCDDDGPSKPHPAMLLAAIQALRAEPARTVMIGDTTHDMKMAKAAGARAQGVGWGFHTPEEVLAGGADHVAMTFAELDAELDRFGAA